MWKKSDYQFIKYGEYMVDRSDGLNFMFVKCEQIEPIPVRYER